MSTLAGRAVPVAPGPPSPHPRLSVNQATIKRASLPEALDTVGRAGVGAIGTWREPVVELGLTEAVRRVADSGLRVSSHCRGGFFTLPEGTARQRALDDNRRAIEETAALAAAGAPGSAPVLVLVAGGLPDGSRDLAGARSRVADALDALVPHALDAGVQLAVEPLHPMYAADRAVVSTLAQALDLAAPFPAAAVGVVVDTFHVWWDPALATSIARAGAARRIASYQVCDWTTPIAADPLLSRGYPGDGHVDFGPVTDAVVAAGYTGDVEVELFNQAIWDTPPAEVVARVVQSFAAAVPLPR
ncbi:sugar phosphate isomerase/epimerase family protein [Curtobacterium sp. MCSS17_016]|uniref:sugar phosphate isomerase/epimerase family protein n=1 Tax=Curtobacterium sp. MCSS17_016 TaxID=2175644 RepID=UPI000DA778EB|nr:sugar phosphate isomerase/epimerase family protein [Curtobacterium sp. MCSS17_016]WIE80283.1 sugar phosphate isomerase/epimerase family protein [Curtobacterium sp. MCSS17_016]